MNSGSIEDKLEIRELMETFAAGAMRVDLEMWGGTWADEGSWKLPSMEAPAIGRSNIIKLFQEKMAYVKYMSMISFPAELQLNAAEGTGKSYCRELIFPKEGDQKVVIGCFDDQYVKRDGRWYFQSRDYEVIGME